MRYNDVIKFFFLMRVFVHIKRKVNRSNKTHTYTDILARTTNACNINAHLSDISRWLAIYGWKHLRRRLYITRTHDIPIATIYIQYINLCAHIFRQRPVNIPAVDVALTFRELEQIYMKIENGIPPSPMTNTDDRIKLLGERFTLGCGSDAIRAPT